MKDIETANFEFSLSHPNQSYYLLPISFFLRIIESEILVFVKIGNIDKKDRLRRVDFAVSISGIKVTN